MKYIKRILGLPFFLGLNIVGMIFHIFLLAYYFIKYGGEAVAYDKKNSPKMIANIYDELVNQRNKSNDTNR